VKIVDGKKVTHFNKTDNAFVDFETKGLEENFSIFFGKDLYWIP